MDLTQLTQTLSNTLHPELRAQAEAQLEQVNGTRTRPYLHYHAGLSMTGTQGATVRSLFVTSGSK